MTNPIYDTYKPPGFHTVNAYIPVKNPPALIDFLKSAFYAVELQCTTESGVIRNCILQVGDSCFMIGKSEETVPSQFYLFCKDPDAMHARALEYGATSVMQVEDRDYGDRQGGVKDVEGNMWWISKRIKDEPYKEHE